MRGEEKARLRRVLVGSLETALGGYLVFMIAVALWPANDRIRIIVDGLVGGAFLGFGVMLPAALLGGALRRRSTDRT